MNISKGHRTKTTEENSIQNESIAIDLITAKQVHFLTVAVPSSGRCNN